MARYVIATGDRVAIVGMTGSGKTVFANHITRGIERLIVLDGKGEDLAVYFCRDGNVCGVCKAQSSYALESD